MDNFQENTVSDKQSMTRNKAAALVVIVSIGFVFAMMWVLYKQLNLIENSAKVTSLESSVIPIFESNSLSSEDLRYLGNLVMESDAQFLRTERAQSLVAARLTVMVIAELIGLCLIVLGGAFIFARIRGKSQISSSEESQTGDKRNFQFLSDFPGLFLCFFGSLLVIWALNTSIDPNARTVTYDAPLFLKSQSSIPTTISDDPAVKQQILDECIENSPDSSLCKGL